MNFQDLKSQQKIHFIGIGGIGMSALAFLLHDSKIEVQGSDLKENYLMKKLSDKNIKYFIGQISENIDDEVSLVIKTSTVKDTNPEIIEAKNRNIKIITRAELLAIIMQDYQNITIAGTHGKTSTTAMTGIMLEVAGLDPTVINGGVINYFSSNYKIGSGKYLVAESDESDASFVDLPTKIGAITNIEAEHLEFIKYDGCFEKQKSYYEQYVKQIPDDGLCVLCVDNDEVKKIYDKLKTSKANLFSYSITDKNADLTIQNVVQDISGSHFDAVFKDGNIIKNIKISCHGMHNISNSLVAIAVARFLKVSDEKIIEALGQCNGVKRRFTKVGEYQGASIIDDYAHHPTEISTTLKSAKQVAGKNKVICVFEPHKYSRVHSLFNEFCKSFSDADYVIVSQVYSTGQEPIEGATQDDLIAGIKKTGHKNVIKLDHENDLAKIIKPLIETGDIVFCAGAGLVSTWAQNLEQQLKNC